MSKMMQKVDDTSFSGKIANGVALVDFFAVWCAPCRALEPILDQLAEDLKDKASFLQIDVDNAPKVTGQFQITSIPTLILFKDGQEVERVVGLKDLDTLKKLVLKHV